MRPGSERPVVYVAGPYSNPDPVENTHHAIGWANLLWRVGAAPLVPHLTLLWHLVSPKPYEQWLELDLNHLRGCDGLLRFPGESSGADGEVAEARRLKIPVLEVSQDRRVGPPSVGDYVTENEVLRPWVWSL